MDLVESHTFQFFLAGKVLLHKRLVYPLKLLKEQFFVDHY